jgi:hypothetical protein
MTSLSDQPAFPVSESRDVFRSHGLTKLEHAAIVLTAAWIPVVASDGKGDEIIRASSLGLAQADWLLRQIEKGGK